MDEVAVGVIIRQALAELLEGPFGCGVGGDVGVENPPRPDLHGDENVQHAHRSSDGNQEVARDDAPGVVSDKGRPALIRRAVAPRPQRIQILADSARRNADAQFQR